MSEQKSICIIYGVNEGQAMGRKLRQACRAAGFTINKDVKRADIILAHSGGALLVPKKTQAQLVMLVGIAYWPGQSWLTATRRHVKEDNATYFGRRAYVNWGLKWLYRGWYFFKFPSLWRMAHNQNLAAPWNNSGSQIIVRNRYDAYCMPDIWKLPFKGPRTFISLPGGHDDCWDSPELYVKLIQSFL